MCQLNFTHVKAKKSALQICTLACSLNSNGNKDGTGFFQSGRLEKSASPPDKIENLNEMIESVIMSNNPVIGHVRKATKLLKEDHSHPFEKGDLILAHNGTLKCKIKEIEDDSTIIDSEKFLNSLHEKWEASDKTDFPKIITDTMEDYQGKFAFLIYNKHNKKYYIVRGRTADLHWCHILKDGELHGIIINTEKSSLEQITYFMKVIYYEGYDSTEIKELDKETIYVYDEQTFTLEKVGEVKEETVVTTTYNRNLAAGWNGNYGGDYTSDFHPLAARIGKLLKSFRINLADLNNMYYFSSGHDLIYETDLDNLEVFMQIIEEIFNANADDNKKVGLWRKIRLGGKSAEFYKKFEYPYLLNNLEELEKYVEEIE